MRNGCGALAFSAARAGALGKIVLPIPHVLHGAIFWRSFGAWPEGTLLFEKIFLRSCYQIGVAVTYAMTVAWISHNHPTIF